MTKGALAPHAAPSQGAGSVAGGWFRSGSALPPPAPCEPDDQATWRNLQKKMDTTVERRVRRTEY